MGKASSRPSQKASGAVEKEVKDRKPKGNAQKVPEIPEFDEGARAERNAYLERELGERPGPPLPSIMKRDTEWLRGHPSIISNVVNLNWWMPDQGTPDKEVLHFDTTEISPKSFEFSPRARRVAALSLNDAMLFAVPRLKGSPKGRCFEVRIIEVNDQWTDQLALGICHLELVPGINGIKDDFKISEAWVFGYDGTFVSPGGNRRIRHVDWSPMKEGDILMAHVTITTPPIFSVYWNYVCIFSSEITPKDSKKYFHACVHINGATRILGIREKDPREFAKQLEQVEQGPEEREREEKVQKAREKERW